VRRPLSFLASVLGLAAPFARAGARVVHCSHDRRSLLARWQRGIGDSPR
jgi:hypothetical protein